MGLITNILTGLLMGRENGKLVTSFSSLKAQERFRHEEILEEMQREHADIMWEMRKK